MQITPRRAPKSRPARLSVQIGRLERAQLVRREDDEEPAYAFQHALTRDTAYDSLLLRQRREIHRAVGGHSTDPSHAQALSLQALDLARELDDREAEARINWNLLLNNRFGNEGPARAIEYGERSIAVSRELGLTEQLALSETDIVNAYAGARQFPRALAVGDEAQGLWRQLDNPLMLAQSLAVGSYAHLVVGDLQGALAQADEAHAIHRAIGSAYGLTISAAFLSIAHRELGRVDKYLELAEQAIQCGEIAGLIRLELISRVVQAWTFAEMGDPARAAVYVRQSLERAEAHDPALRMWPLAVLVRLHLRQGEVEAASALIDDVPLESFEEYVRLLVVTATFEDVAVAHIELAIARGEFARAVTIADHLLASLERTGARIQIPGVTALKARALEGQGRADLALALLKEASRLAETIQARMRLWPILLNLSELESRHGHATEAQAARVRARQVIEQIAAQSPAELCESFLAQAQAVYETVQPATDGA